ncbi:EAL domain-containing protein [Alkalihalobacterium alkalinitrilicum]|uniref:bifunctional diguanylate cyclase/phosphodiesterase n=1 Tax=Alkalihalobacterium alkalinitrilicum TaxID=427920 RepID=UPI00130315D4|nr:EAL domain-containing protein [Alkalihalobacterium alkalinitrilicum]
MSRITIDKQTLKAQNKVLRMTATGSSLTEILTTLALEIETLIPKTYCSILLLNDEKQTLENGIGPSLDESYNEILNGTQIGPSVGSCGTAAYRRERVIVKDIEKYILWKEYKSLALSYGLKAYWSQPILSSDGTVLGTFGLYYGEPKVPNIRELGILEDFTHLASVAIEHKKTNEKLQQSEQQYRLLAENVSDFVGLLNQQGVYEYVSPSHEKYLGYSSFELVGKNWLDFVHPDDVNNAIWVFEKQVKIGAPQKLIFRYKHKNGQWIYLEGKGTPIQEEDGLGSRLVYMARDITEQKRAEEQLKIVVHDLEQTQQKFDSLYNNSLDAIFEIDSEGKYYRVNSVAEKITGYQKEELVKLGINDLIIELEKVNNIFTRIKNGESLRVELTLRHKKGHYVNIDVNGVPVFRDDGTVNVIAFVQDITGRKRAEEELRELAYKDSLTGLPTRELFSIELDKAIKSAKEYKYSLGILFIDFDNFKNVNDTLGHHFGDQVLKKLVKIMESQLGKDNLISRQGGDEFLILVENTDKEKTGIICERLIKRLTSPIELHGHEVFITPSIGVCMFPEYEFDAEILIKNADLAMYMAKDIGKNNYQFFSDNLNDQVLRKSRVTNALRKALGNGEFTLHYQPQFELSTNRVKGIEALLRWNPEFGFVSPAEFIPIAEETGLIVEIGEWVLREACKHGKEWNDKGVLKTPVSVNVSARQFKERSFIETVKNVLKETGLPPSNLEIEITERVMIDVNEAVNIVNQLRMLGVRVAIDDFGVGYSSLNMLQSIVIDSLKIDRAFLHDVMKNKRSAGLLEAIIRMGADLGSNVVVEGIETKDQVDFLLSKGVIGQGYYYSRPLPADDLEQYLESLKLKS